MDSDSRMTTEQIMQQLTQALQESRGRTEQQLTDLSRKLDQLARDLQTTESRLRADLQTQFISRQEYDPRHAQLEQKAVAFEKHIQDAEQQFRTIAILQVEQKQLRLDFDELDSRQRTVASRAVPWIAVAISLISAVAAVLQHIQFR